jgi:predicted DNA binding protein
VRALLCLFYPFNKIKELAKKLKVPKTMLQNHLRKVKVKIFNIVLE